MKIPTVKIVNGDGYAIINESDFDAKAHKLFKEGNDASPKSNKKTGGK